MWRIYSPGNEGVVIQTSVKKFYLLKDVRFAALGPVIYYGDMKKALDQIKKDHQYDVFTEAFLKRNAFKHEDEVRLVTMNDPRCLVRRPPNGASRFEVDLDPRVAA